LSVDHLDIPQEIEVKDCAVSQRLSRGDPNTVHTGVLKLQQHKRSNADSL